MSNRLKGSTQDYRNNEDGLPAHPLGWEGVGDSSGGVKIQAGDKLERQIAEVRQRFPQAVCLALTATATQQVREDIKSSLVFQDDNEFVASFDRENLFIEVLPKTDPERRPSLFCSLTRINRA